MITPRGRHIAVDVGSVRVGVAVCDPDGILATPVETIRRAKDGSDIARLIEIITEYEAIGVVIGLPRTLRGEEGPAVRAARYFGRQLTSEFDGVSIEFYDERLTTVTATQALRASGVKAKDARAVVDQAAAVAILQGWLDAQR
ncbi:Holliday junction resolvase RuvX [Gordonia phthalatica]|uniref:Putative pre-16S rRNA nuclease n=1 Tax=Gordonia phthalatica TaxID=1136941 RepID=A0A0N9NAY3_9ACTN|nr:Holliday junction resolvase RuvX [Gordonia phthalatica]ALG84730.1 Holliday junction resolvase [Gordonia phthalatica]